MSNRDNKIFDKIKKKTNLSEKQLRNIASHVNPKDLQDEKKVRALVAHVGAMAGVPVSKEKEDLIVKYLVKNKISPQQMQSMINMITQPKK